MKVEQLRRILLFIRNKDIEIVEDIFKGQVNGSQLYHLINKAEEYSKKNENNTAAAWFDFILALDLENSTILINYMFPKTNQINLLDMIEEQEKLNIIGKGMGTFEKEEEYLTQKGENE